MGLSRGFPGSNSPETNPSLLYKPNMHQTYKPNKHQNMPKIKWRKFRGFWVQPPPDESLPDIKASNALKYAQNQLTPVQSSFLVTPIVIFPIGPFFHLALLWIRHDIDPDQCPPRQREVSDTGLVSLVSM